MIWDSWTVTNVYALKCPKCPMIRLKFVIKKSKATPKKYGVASYTKMLKLFGNLPCRRLLERMKSYGSCTKGKKKRCHWIGYPL